MDLRIWSKPEIESCGKILSSDCDEARADREEFLQSRIIAEFMGESARNGLRTAGIGAGLGILSSLAGNRRKSIGRTLGFSLLGGAVGLAASMAWKSRHLITSVNEEAASDLGRIADEQWMKEHFIAYA
jgi:hypothetical protein